MMLAKLLQCPTSDPNQLEACLQKADSEKITSKQYDVLKKRKFLHLPFVPHVDGDFLLDKPEVGASVVHVWLRMGTGVFCVLFSLHNF